MIDGAELVRTLVDDSSVPETIIEITQWGSGGAELYFVSMDDSKTELEHGFHVKKKIPDDDSTIQKVERTVEKLETRYLSDLDNVVLYDGRPLSWQVSNRDQRLLEVQCSECSYSDTYRVEHPEKIELYLLYGIGHVTEQCNCSSE